ncbi:unnamed protein product [Acanthoscelides obtectus]|uniref:Uncharacterized protein n=1 Tax=Acanthoscelides obtectus TaxID=200917 RepID=A0A9P0LT22_ACAOB|nr:unnamed protein product [Acanthoscelides obtectus]CAK1638760.1 hypothetical protein AOBTE_LOCUS10806 [Acanthoscelides obtectus]
MAKWRLKIWLKTKCQRIPKNQIRKVILQPLKNIAFLSRVNRVETQLISIIELRKRH